jgi:RNA polymerase sigma-70 factor (ECF subfamily)
LSPEGPVGGDDVSVGEISIEDAYAAWADDLVRYAAVLVAPRDAADVVADAFANLLDNETTWNRAVDPRRFLFGVVANTARSHHRTAARRSQRASKVVALRPVPDRDEHEVVAPQEHVIGALGDLSPQQRAVIYLAYWEDLSVADISETLGVSDGTVRRQLARARERLRKVLP